MSAQQRDAVTFALSMGGACHLTSDSRPLCRVWLVAAELPVVVSMLLLSGHVLVPVSTEIDWPD